MKHPTQPWCEICPVCYTTSNSVSAWTGVFHCDKCKKDIPPSFDKTVEYDYSSTDTFEKE